MNHIAYDVDEEYLYEFEPVVHAVKSTMDEYLHIDMSLQSAERLYELGLELKRLMKITHDDERQYKKKYLIKFNNLVANANELGITINDEPLRHPKYIKAEMVAIMLYEGADKDFVKQILKDKMKVEKLPDTKDIKQFSFEPSDLSDWLTN